jgi:hypothetical protein
MYSIEIDEKVWGFLQKHAEPFIDTPNSVLNQILFGASKETDKVNGYSRTEATNRVAQKRGTAPQTITDKYCRQIGKKAHEIDQLLSESGYDQFKALLKSKFSNHAQVIDTYFESLMMGVG